MKKAYIAAICVCVVLCCTFGFMIFSEIISPSSVGAHENSSSEKVQSVTISEGDAAVLETDNDYRQSATEWSSDNEEIVTVEGGGRIDALKQGSACVTANLANGDRVKFNITVSAPKKQAEADKFSTAYTANQDILKKNLANKSKKKLPYQIMVNRSQNCVTVYTYDSEGKYTVPVRAMVCSCGKDNSTVLGIYDIQYRCEWQSLVKESFGQYACQFYGDYLFHSVPYSDISKSSLKSDEYNKLGSPGSMGCVRLSAGDCKWVYDNCADRTAVGENCEVLADAAVQTCFGDFLTIYVVGFAQDVGFFFCHITDNADGKTGTREGLAHDEVFGQTKLTAQLAHFVLKKQGKRFEDILESGYNLRRQQFIVMTLDHIGITLAGFNHIRVNSTLGQEVFFGDSELLCLITEDISKFSTDDMSFGLRVRNSG